MTRLRIEHNLDHAELTTALTASILDAGIESRVVEELSKANGRGTGTETPKEAEVRRLLTEWERADLELRALILRSAEAFIAYRQQAQGRRILFGRKPTPAPVSPEDVRALGALVSEMYRISAMIPGYSNNVFDWNSPYARLWRQAGIGFSMQQEIDAYPVLGVLPVYAQAWAEGDRAFRNMGARYPLDQRYAARWAAIHAGGFIRNIGLGLEQKINAQGAAIMAANYPGTIAYFIAHTKNEGGDFVENQWRNLAALLTQVIDEPGTTRDMLRVAHTELRYAWNTGLLQTYARQGLEAVQYNVQPTACAHCKRVYLLPNGQPKTFTLARILTTIAADGGINYGKPPAEYEPAAILHPYCHCYPVPAQLTYNLAARRAAVR